LVPSLWLGLNWTNPWILSKVGPEKFREVRKHCLKVFCEEKNRKERKITKLAFQKKFNLKNVSVAPYARQLLSG